MADEQQLGVTEAIDAGKQRQCPWQGESLKESRAVGAAAISESRNAGTPRQSMHACSLSNELPRPDVTGGVMCGVGREEWFSGAEGGESGGDQERTISKRFCPSCGFHVGRARECSQCFCTNMRCFSMPVSDLCMMRKCSRCFAFSFSKKAKCRKCGSALLDVNVNVPSLSATVPSKGHDSGAPGADASAYEGRSLEKEGAAIAWQPTGDGVTEEGQETEQEGWNTIPAQQQQHQQYRQQLPPLSSQALPAGPNYQHLPGVAPTEMMSVPASARHQDRSNRVGEFIPHAMSAGGRSKGVQQQDQFQRLPHQAVLHPPQMTRPPPHLPRPPDTRVAMKSAPAEMYAPMGPGQTWYLYPGGGGPPLGVSGYGQAIQVFHPTVEHTPLAFGQTQGYPRYNFGAMAHPGTYPLPPGPPLYHGHVQQQQQQCQPQHHQQPPREKEQPGILPLPEGSISTGGSFGPPLPTPPLEQHSESSGSFGSIVSGGLEWEWTEDEWDIFERLVLAVVATVLDSESDDSGAARLGAIDDGMDDKAGEGGRGEDVTPPQPSPSTPLTPPAEDVPATEDLVDDELSPIFVGNRASEVAADAVGVGGASNVSEEGLGVAFDETVKNAEKVPRGEILAGFDAAPEKQWVATAVDEGPVCDAIALCVAGKIGGPQVAADGNDNNLPTRSKRGVLDSVPAQREEVLSPEQDAPAAEGPDSDRTSWRSSKKEGLETEAEAAAAERVVIGGHRASGGAASDGAREEGGMWQQWKHFSRIAGAPEEDVPAEEGGKHVHNSLKSTAGRANGTPDDGEVTSDTTDMAESGDVIAHEAEGNDEIVEADNNVVAVDDEAAKPEDEALDGGGKVVKGVDHTEEAEGDTAVVENDNEVPKADDDMVNYDDIVMNFEDRKVDADYVVEVDGDEAKADDETDDYVKNVAEGEDPEVEANDGVAMVEGDDEIRASGGELAQADSEVVGDDVKVAKGGDRKAESDEDKAKADDDVVENNNSAESDGDHVSKDEYHEAESDDEISEADDDVVNYEDIVTIFEDQKGDAGFVVEVNENEAKADDETDDCDENVVEGEDPEAEANDDVAMVEGDDEIAASGDELAQADSEVVEDDIKVAKGGDRKAESDEDKAKADDDVVENDNSAASDGDHVSKDEYHEAESDDGISEADDEAVDVDLNVVNDEDHKTDADDDKPENDGNTAETNDAAKVHGAVTDDVVEDDKDKSRFDDDNGVEDKDREAQTNHKASSDDGEAVEVDLDMMEIDDDVMDACDSVVEAYDDEATSQYSLMEINDDDTGYNNVAVEAGDDLVEADDGVAEDEDGAKKADDVAKVVDDGAKAEIDKDRAKADGNVVMNDDFTPIDGDFAEKGDSSTESEYDFFAEANLEINRGVSKVADSMVSCGDRTEDDDTAKDGGTAEDDKYIAGAVDYIEIDDDVVEKDMVGGNEADNGPVVRADRVARNSPMLSQPLVRALNTASIPRAINHAAVDSNDDKADVDGNHGTDDGSSDVPEYDDDRGRNGDDEISQIVSVRETMPTPFVLPQPPVEGQNDATVAPTITPNGVVAPATNHNAPAVAATAPIAVPSPVEDDEAAPEHNEAEVEAAPLLETSGGDGAGIRWRRGLTSIRIDRVVAVTVATVLLAFAAERSSTACARGNELRSGEAPLTPGSCIEGATGFRSLGWIPGLSAKPTLSVTAGGELVARRTDGREVVLRGNVPGERSEGGFLCHAARLGRAVAGWGNAEFGARFVHGQLVLGAEYFCSLFRTPLPPELSSAGNMAFQLECDGRVGFSENGDLEIVIGDPPQSERIWSLAEELSSNRGK